MIVTIDRKNYRVNLDEFRKTNKIANPKYGNLTILESVGVYERVISLIDELGELNNHTSCFIVNPTHGGFIPINCSSNFESVGLLQCSVNHKENIEDNIKTHNVTNIAIDALDVDVKLRKIKDSILYASNDKDIDFNLINRDPPIIVTTYSSKIAELYSSFCIFKLTRTDLRVYIPDIKYSSFFKHFHYYINSKNEIDYDNLINLCIMVKNGGEQFEKMLLKNLSIINRWTILDTGSTDGTIDVIKKVLVGKKPGKIYQEPFINFRDSRNRCLELAGDKCKYTLMVDDTYTIEGASGLIEFLNDTRGDQMSDSFYLYIKSEELEYVSNRLLKTYRKLKYMFKIHEVVQEEDNKMIIIPKSHAYIDDYKCDYMAKRTADRIDLDFKYLYEELEEDPNNPRTYYYLGQTYLGIKNYEKAYEYYLKRVQHKTKGFIYELVDAAFECARIANFNLQKPWEECEKLYLKSYELDNTRPEPLYFLGNHYYLNGNVNIAYDYLKRAFKMGIPTNAQFNIKVKIITHYIPKFLTYVCYEMKDYVLGEEASSFFLNNNPCINGIDDNTYNIVASWYHIYRVLNKLKPEKNRHIKPMPKTTSDKPYLCFVADGGFSEWTGRDILTKGVGGSETYVIEMARHIQESGQFQVFVFCNCLENDNYEGVEYLHLNDYFSFIVENKIHSCIVSRFSEYLPVTYKGLVENVYLVLHDLGPTGIVIPIDEKLKKVFCLTEWHAQYFINNFPALEKYTTHLYYGIDVEKFSKGESTLEIVPYQFIYSSFPNRGLLQLLEMWGDIIEKQPKASLHIFADVDGNWVNSIAPKHMEEIRKLLNKYKSIDNSNIHYRGWTSKEELAKTWLSSEFWFYPCTFMETFCLTALEAALSKTVVITNDLAALNNTVSDRGVIIRGDPSTKEWKREALKRLFNIMDDKERKDHYIKKNYEWAKPMSWKNQAIKLLLHLQ
jgi:tetratricopeptide (TPR) repeat protein